MARGPSVINAATIPAAISRLKNMGTVVVIAILGATARGSL
jgi:hypothetical protein